MRKSSVSKRKFSEFIHIGCTDHFFEAFFILCCIKIYDDSIFKFEIHPGDELSKIIKWLIKFHPTICLSSIGGSENFEGRDIRSSSSQSLSIRSDFYGNVCIFSDYMNIFYGQSIEFVFDDFNIFYGFFSLSNRIIII